MWGPQINFLDGTDEINTDSTSRYFIHTPIYRNTLESIE